MIDVKVALDDLNKIIADAEKLKRELTATKVAGEALRERNEQLRGECHRMGVKLDYYRDAVKFKDKLIDDLMKVPSVFPYEPIYYRDRDYLSMREFHTLRFKPRDVVLRLDDRMFETCRGNEYAAAKWATDLAKRADREVYRTVMRGFGHDVA